MVRVSMLALSVAAVLAPVSVGLAQYGPGFHFPIIEAEQAAGRRLFNDHCAACHVEKTGARVALAPSLRGVVGRQAASVPGFPYSDALKNSGLVWTEANLRKWIANNAQLVPNTLMPHVSIPDPAEQIYVVAYLKTLRP